MRRPISIAGGRIAVVVWAVLSLLCLGMALADVGPAAWVDAVQEAATGGYWPMLTWLVLTLGVLPLALLPGLLYDAATGQGLFQRRRPSDHL